jgi:GNAT superfamily N-acetyltransferase
MNIRLARPTDALAVAQVHVRSWQAGYCGLLPQEYLDGLRPEDRAASYNFIYADPLQPRTLVAATDHAICGFVSTMPSRESDLKSAAELAALYVDPTHWGNGIGHALMTSACEHLVFVGYQHACLWLLVGNERAARFYAHHGWQMDGRQKTDTVWGVTVEEVRYQRNLVPA